VTTLILQVDPILAQFVMLGKAQTSNARTLCDPARDLARDTGVAITRLPQIHPGDVERSVSLAPTLAA
jgi:hypothetical protein